jgi:hypothetical protein
MGAAIALPWLEAMIPSPVRAAGSFSSKPALRVVFTYHTLGAESTAWKGVTGDGRQMQLTPTLRALEPVKEHLLILDGLDGRTNFLGSHARGGCLWLSSAPPGERDSFGQASGVTLDQVLAPKLSEGARQKSLELSCNKTAESMHSMFLSWRGAGVPMGAETDPRDVFARMFGDAKRDFYQRSILDVVAEEARWLRSNLGHADRGRLDEYLESVRSLEQQISAFERNGGKRLAPTVARPEELPPSLPAYVKLMTDLLVVALRTDFTRVITFAPGDESQGANSRTLADFGIDKAPFAGQVDAKYLDYGHHKCSHDPKPTLPIIQAVDRWYVEQFAYLLQELQAIPEGEGSLLDHSIVVYGSNFSSGSGNGWPGHSRKDVACILAGKGSGLLPKPGRHIRFAEGTPLSNLWLTLARMVGIERREFGLSTGTLAGLG